MRLIHTSTLKLVDFFAEKVPQYAILSHRWESDEVTFEDMRGGREKTKEKAGFKKIQKSCARAAMEGYDYVWIDCCCIDKSSSAELSEAINSMFQWYQRAQVCYAYLSDVSSSRLSVSIEEGLRNSQWFTRGWTLQELLAPQSVEFFDRNWNEIGTKASMQELIQSITGINHLFNYSEACVAQKMSWASRRVTTRVEDQAYCLLGLFDVNMPPLYGEGENAFHRLQLEILRKSDDESIFAWDGKHNGLEATGFPYEGMLASSISAFEKSWRFQRAIFDSNRSPYSMTNKGLHLELLL
ncbi:HET-domain-containing protein, partial [Stipitochalara longipes BDJ]